ncbi:MAG: deoxyribonuclease IV [Clostridia bacterium]|jgi:deoxyribonuclease-4|nr:deoxyribonuclease IV [Clostridia bacterium]MCI2001085.1 deoxyribonuclease IV [Clostridia bacterium]MCI2015789.1 deoxyribonuclease IV [Clostridia bacterium]
MLIIGSHLSISKGFYACGKQAVDIGANTFQFFSRNPRGSKAKDIDKEDIKKLIELCEKNNFGKLLAHAPYTLNPCSKDERTRQFALETMSDDLKRMEYLPNNLYNFHPGSHTGQGTEKGIEEIVWLLNNVLFEGQTTTVLLETMSGKGTEVGSRFEELKSIIDKVELKDKMGVCLDTCHVYCAGYDIKNDLDGVLDEFDNLIGLERLRAIHLNDSMQPFNSHKDRHEKIGEGSIGLDAFERIINNKRLKNIPFLLETPNEIEGYKKEISMLRSMAK